MIKRIFIFINLLVVTAQAQFAPPATVVGSTAIHKDSSVFVQWASFCEVTRGYQDVSNTSLGYATVGDSSMALGIAGSNGVVSLGDGGVAVLNFPYPIMDGPGWDFAVFENSFSADFLEFAFVEVSSDGINYYRFPSISNIQDTIQTGTFGLSDASLVNNLAGKYEAFYGTPFDLNELSGISGLDLNTITHVKVIDVVGSISSPFSQIDSQGEVVNDPWPTPFPSSGFDLDAVGVIHANTSPLGIKNNKSTNVIIFPNPCVSGSALHLTSVEQLNKVSLLNSMGEEIPFSVDVLSNTQIEIALPFNLSGIYYLKTVSKTKTTLTKIIIQ